MDSTGSNLFKLVAGLSLLACLCVGLHRTLPFEDGIADPLQREIVRAAALDEQFALFNERQRLWDSVLLNLIEGVFQLREAADRYLAIFEPPPDFAQQLLLLEEGDSDDERMFNSLIRAARDRLAGDPVRAEFVSQRLEREMRRTLGQKDGY